jgi:hypothetical protein
MVEPAAREMLRALDEGPWQDPGRRHGSEAVEDRYPRQTSDGASGRRRDTGDLTHALAADLKPMRRSPVESRRHGRRASGPTWHAARCGPGKRHADVLGEDCVLPGVETGSPRSRAATAAASTTRRDSAQRYRRPSTGPGGRGGRIDIRHCQAPAFLATLGSFTTFKRGPGNIPGVVAEVSVNGGI